MKVRKLSLIVIVALLLLLIVASLVYEKGEQAAEERSAYALSPNEVELLQEGDVILRRGYGMVSRMIATKMEGRYELSHCGVVVERAGQKWVVHTVSSSLSETDGMQIHRLEEFVRQSKAESIVVARPRNAAGPRLAERCLHYLAEEVPFDHDFDIEDASSFYCSELIWRSLDECCGVDGLAGRYDDPIDYYSFDAFLNPEIFDIVLNHQGQ